MNKKNQWKIITHFLDKALKASTPEEILDLFFKALANIGIDKIAYGALRARGYQLPHDPLKMATYPDEWVKIYLENQYMVKDAITQHGFFTRNPFLWKSVRHGHTIKENQKLILDQASEFGLDDGISVPVHGPMGELYMMGLASAAPNPDLEHFKTELGLLVHQFHLLYYGLLEEEQTNTTNLSPLTAKEEEILKWCSEGHSNKSIATILNVSQHTIDFHIRNIFSKLDVDNRVAAVTKAIKNGWLLI